MKKFVSENWYKLMIGSSMLMASFGFMVHSVSPAHAEPSYLKENAAPLSSNGTGPEDKAQYWVEYNGYAYQINVNYDPEKVISENLNGRSHIEYIRKLRLN